MFQLQDDIDEEDERLLEAFLSKETAPQRTLADIIVAKIKEKDANVSSGLDSLTPIIRSTCILYSAILFYMVIPF